MHLVEMADIREAVERMLNPQRRDPLEALSPAGRTVYEGMAATLAESLDLMAFQDKMAACQSLFDLIEEYEKNAIQEHRQKRTQILRESTPWST